MIYSTEHIAKKLKRAREAHGLSQRELSTKSGLPQSHISKIESGAVDLRLSSLVQLTHALELKLMLVPRRSISAVNSIVRGYPVQAADKGARQAREDLTQLKVHAARVARMHPTMTELAWLQRIARDLVHYRISAADLQVVGAATEAVKMFENDSASIDALRNALARIDKLRNTLAHDAVQRLDAERVLPAYSLDEDDYDSS